MGLIDWLAGISAADAPIDKEYDRRAKREIALENARKDIQETMRREGIKKTYEPKVGVWKTKGKKPHPDLSNINKWGNAPDGKRDVKALMLALKKYPEFDPVELGAVQEHWSPPQRFGHSVWPNAPKRDPHAIESTQSPVEMAIWWGPLAFNLAKMGVQALPKIPQTARNIRNPNVTARGFVRDPATGKEMVVGHGTTRQIKTLDPSAAKATDEGWMAAGTYGAPVRPRLGVNQKFNSYSIRKEPHIPGVHDFYKGGKELHPGMEEFYKHFPRSQAVGTPTTHLYKLGGTGKPYVHGKMSVKEMEAVEASIRKILEKNPKIGLAEAKRQGLLKNGYTSEIYDPMTISRNISGSAKIGPPRPIGPAFTHPSALSMNPRDLLFSAENVALTPKAIAPRWNPVSRPFPTQQFVLPAIGTQQ